MTIDPEMLASLPLFQGLDPAQLAILAGLSRRRTVAAGTVLMTADETGSVAYVILDGTVKIHVQQADGGEVILGIRGPGELLGEMSLLDRQTHSASVIAQETCHLLAIDSASFLRTLEEMPSLYRNLVRILSRRLRLATAQIQALAALDAYGRVARQILVLAEEYGQTAPDGTVSLPLRLTQSDLAGMVGASRVRVNEVIVTYKRLGYLAVDAEHHMTVLDPAALRQRCS